MIIKKMTEEHYDSLYFCHDPGTKLNAIIGIHNVNLGPALGGLRFYPYRNEDEAVTDVMNLARGMTYKASISGLNLGGGKSVIIGDPGKDKTEKLLMAFGRFMNDLNGKYITAEDSGTSEEDMDAIRKVTKYVTGVSPKNGGSGDPSPFTATGCFRGIQACLAFTDGSESLKGKHVAVQGVGSVGYYLTKHLVKAGAKVTVTDIDKNKIERCRKEFGTSSVGPDDIYSVECDIFSPCALAWAVNDETIKKFRCRIVAGAANNQLKNPANSDELFKKEIVYAPDYAINAGGLISVGDEWFGYDLDRVNKRVENIFNTITTILKRSRKENLPTHIIADKIAEERFLKGNGKWRV